MAINLKALRARLTPVTEAQAQEIVAAGVAEHTQRHGLASHDALPLSVERAKTPVDADMAANVHRYPPAARNSSAMDSENETTDDPQESPENAAAPTQNRQDEPPKP